MHSVLIANTGISVTCFGYGTGSLHHVFNSAARQRLLCEAESAGITHFDTAPYYGLGLAELDLGRYLRGRRARYTVTTKVGLYAWGASANSASSVWARKAIGRVMPRISLPAADWSEARARQSLDVSLRRLGTDYVDFLFLHEPDKRQVDEDAYIEWLTGERARGRIRAWGIAGSRTQIGGFVEKGSQLAQVVQTKDSLSGREARFLLDRERPLQFTYGYFNSAHHPAPDPSLILKRNPTGAVLISTKRPERLKALGRLAG